MDVRNADLTIEDLTEDDARATEGLEETGPASAVEPHETEEQRVRSLESFLCPQLHLMMCFLLTDECIGRGSG